MKKKMSNTHGEGFMMRSSWLQMRTGWGRGGVVKLEAGWMDALVKYHLTLVSRYLNDLHAAVKRTMAAT